MILTVGNTKGGVGKTTIALNIAISRALTGRDVWLNKTTIFNADPTREMVAAKLQEQAAQLGADAVIFVRYGNVGVSLMSWGSLEGKGRAVKFQ